MNFSISKIAAFLLAVYITSPAVDCGVLDDPNNGQVSLDGTTPGSNATYTCDPGFSLIGNMERICQQNGQWSGSEPTCEGQSYNFTKIMYLVKNIPFKQLTVELWMILIMDRYCTMRLQLALLRHTHVILDLC